MTALGLRRIILVDSFMAGKSLAIQLDQHANLSGTNGSGKTTCLRLIPFFYGMEPGQLENQAAGKKSFVDWYLPRPSSLLIFEYDRQDGCCCAVAYRHPSGTKPAYRFKRGGFIENDFCYTDDRGKTRFYPSAELASHWHKQGVECSSQLELVIDYRAIIQQDKALLNRSQRAKQLRRLASRYCLGEIKSRMRHLEKVTHAILGRQGSMEKIKLMLADIMQEDGLQVPLPPKHAENRTIADDLSSLRDFQLHSKRFEQTLNAYHALSDCRHELATLHHNLKHQQQSLSQTQESLQIQLNQHVQLLTQHESNARSERRQLDDKLDGAIKNERSLEQEINLLQERFDAFEKHSAEHLSQELDRLPQYQHQLSQARSNVQNLSNEIKTEQHHFEQLKNEEILRHQKFAQKIQEQRAQHKQDLSQHKEHYLNALNESDHAYYQEQNTYSQQYQQHREHLLSEKNQAETSLIHSLPNEKQQLETHQLNQSLDAIEHEIHELERRLNTQQDQDLRAKQQEEQDQEHYTQAKQRCQNAQTALNELLQWLEPDTASWLYQLKQSTENWQQDIAKIIKPELLLDTKLNPIFKQSASHCYGWQLDLSHIKSSHASYNHEKLTADIESCQQRLQAAEQDLASTKAQWKKSQQACGVLSKQVDEYKRRLHTAKQKRSSLRASLKQLQQIIAESLTEKKQQAQARIQLLTQAIEEHHSQHQLRIKQDEQYHQHGKQQLTANYALEESRINQAIASEEQALLDESCQHQENLKQFQAQFEHALTKKGIETTLIEQAKLRVDALKTRINDLEQQHGLIHEYRYFIKDKWSQKPRLEQELTRVQKEKNIAEQALSQALTHHQLEEKALIQQKQNIEQQCRETIQLKEQVSELIKKITQEPHPELLSLPCQSLIQRTRDLLQTEFTLSQQVTDGVHYAQQQINKHSQSQIALAWNQECDVIFKQHQLDPNTPEYFEYLPQALEHLIEKHIPQLEQTLIETTRVIASQLSLFYQGLHDINNHLRSQAKRISTSIAQYTLLDALTDIKLELTSKIETLDYWQLLQEFSLTWKQWHQKNDNRLPTPDLITNFATLLSQLEKARLNQNVASLFSLNIHLQENGRSVIIRNDNDLLHASSTGLSYLALCAIFIGICRLLCPDKRIALHWPVDELGIIDAENINHLFAMLQAAEIVMLGGFPSTDPELLKHFKHKHWIDKQAGLKMMAVNSGSLRDKLHLRPQETAGEAHE